MPKILFYSRELPGIVMNRYGVVMDAGMVVDPDTRSIVRLEAVAAGWRLVESGDSDVGRVYAPPENLPAG